MTLPAVPNGGTAVITGITFHPKISGTISLSTQGSGNVGVVRSTDGGASYTITNNGLTSTQVTEVATNPQTPSMLFVATASGVFKSINNGDPWSLSTTLPTGVISFDANVTPPTMCWAMAINIFCDLSFISFIMA
jgi:hypothetical protein